MRRGGKTFQLGLHTHLMPYIPIGPGVMDRYLRGDSVYVGPTTPVNYRVAASRVNPYTGNLEMTGWREERSEAFPVLPGMFLAWTLMGILNSLTGKLSSWFGLKENPLRLMFHYGYALKEEYDRNDPGNGYGGYNGNGNGRKHSTNDWERDLECQLYPLD